MIQQHPNTLQSFPASKISSFQSKNVKGGSGTITVLDTDMESIVKQHN